GRSRAAAGQDGGGGRKCLRGKRIQEKLKLVNRIRCGESQARVSREAGVPESTLRGWLKEELKLRTFTMTASISRKRARPARDVTLDTVVYNWIMQKKSQGIPIPGPRLKAQAEKFSKVLNGDTSFVASQGWLHRFNKRHGFSQIKFNCSTTVLSSPQDLKTILEKEQLSDEQVYIAGESVLYYRMLPEQSLAVKNTDHESEDRVTFLFATNKPGTHKAKPLCIGKYRSPWFFHRLNMKSMPIDYNHSRNARMTSDIFRDWFFNSFVPSVQCHLRSKGLSEKAVLLLDNSPAHPPAAGLQDTDCQIKVLYLPKNTASKIHPLDLGIIGTFKKNYRTELVKEFVYSDLMVTEYLNQMNLKDVFKLATRAWDEVSTTCIQRCWLKGLCDAFTEEPTDDIIEDDIFVGFTAEEILAAQEKLKDLIDEDVTLSNWLEFWTTIDDDAPITEYLTDEQLIAQVQNNKAETEEPEISRISVGTNEPEEWFVVTVEIDEPEEQEDPHIASFPTATESLRMKSEQREVQEDPQITSIPVATEDPAEWVVVKVKSDKPEEQGGLRKMCIPAATKVVKVKTEEPEDPYISISPATVQPEEQEDTHRTHVLIPTVQPEEQEDTHRTSIPAESVEVKTEELEKGKDPTNTSFRIVAEALMVKRGEPEDQEDLHIVNVPTATEAVKALKIGLAWLETQDINAVQCIQLKNVLQFAQKKAEEQPKNMEVD
uniref:HTH CENPB-type domain-containing protein n=1 Tax=Callorhinchus milii TaxID=7868 RepID=A0A4W3J4W6_CALMI